VWERKRKSSLHYVVSSFTVVFGDVACPKCELATEVGELEWRLRESAERWSPPVPSVVGDHVRPVGDQWSVVCVELARLVGGSVVVRVTDWRQSTVDHAVHTTIHSERVSHFVHHSLSATRFPLPNWTIHNRACIVMACIKAKGQGHWERKCKSFFRAYLGQKWVDLCQTKTKMVTGLLLYTCHRIHSTGGNALFLRSSAMSNPLRLHVAAANWPCSYLFLTNVTSLIESRCPLKSVHCGLFWSSSCLIWSCSR